MDNAQNTLIFRDTEKLCRNNGILLQATKQAVAEQRAILETDPLADIVYGRYKENSDIVVSQKRTLEAAQKYKGQKTVVHNFASATNPGGGVEHGANAQEECLCRCSNLYFCLNIPDMWASFYHPHRNEQNPLHNDDIIYTPGVTVFKTDTAAPELMDENDWYPVDVITCAAPNLRKHPGNRYNTGDGDKRCMIQDSDLSALHEKRLKRILDVAVLHHAETVILGAFGCGAFFNPPEAVAHAAKTVIGNYLKAFRTIEFAVYCPPGDKKNYLIFDETFRSLTK